MGKVHEVAVLIPESTLDLAKGKESQRDRLSEAIDVGDVEIGHAGAVPEKRDALAVRRPERIGGMLNVNQLLDTKLRFMRGGLALRAGTKCQHRERRR